MRNSLDIEDDIAAKGEVVGAKTQSQVDNLIKEHEEKERAAQGLPPLN